MSAHPFGSLVRRFLSIGFLLTHGPVAVLAGAVRAARARRGDALALSAGRVVAEILDPIETRGLGVDDRAEIASRVRADLAGALRPCHGGSAERSELGPF